MELTDLGKGLDAGKYPLLSQLAERGISGLYDVARREFGYTSRRKGYLNQCDLCTDIRSFLIRVNPDGFAELAPKGFYDELG